MNIEVRLWRRATYADGGQNVLNGSKEPWLKRTITKTVPGRPVTFQGSQSVCISDDRSVILHDAKQAAMRPIGYWMTGNSAASGSGPCPTRIASLRMIRAISAQSSKLNVKGTRMSINVDRISSVFGNGTGSA